MLGFSSYLRVLSIEKSMYTSRFIVTRFFDQGNLGASARASLGLLNIRIHDPIYPAK